jgi:hypothetical protein
MTVQARQFLGAKRISAVVMMLLCSLVLLTACVRRHPVGIAPSSAPVSASYTVLNAVEDSDCLYILFGLIPLGGKDPTFEIIDRLVKANGADALVGVTVELKVTSYLIVATECTVVNGKAVKNAK